MTAKQEIHKKRNRVLQIGRRYGVASIKLFGSSVREEEQKTSDLDFLVELEPGRSLFDLGGLQTDLEIFFKRKVDIVTPKGLRQRMRSKVLKEAIPL